MAGMEGKAGGLRNEPNVVPMIDVLLVLLIIFMITIPMSRVAIDLQLPDPKPPEEKQPDLTTPSTLVTSKAYTYNDTFPNSVQTRSYFTSATTTDVYV